MKLYQLFTRSTCQIFDVRREYYTPCLLDHHFDTFEYRFHTRGGSESVDDDDHYDDDIDDCSLPRRREFHNDDDDAFSGSLRGSTGGGFHNTTGTASITSADLELQECPHHPNPQAFHAHFAPTSRQVRYHHHRHHRCY